jgi:serine/threonine protein kinase
MFPGAPNEAVDLLKKMLQFNPYQRITLEECLSHPFIAAYSKKELMAQQSQLQAAAAQAVPQVQNSIPDGPVRADPNLLKFHCATLQFD